MRRRRQVRVPPASACRAPAGPVSAAAAAAAGGRERDHETLLHLQRQLPLRRALSAQLMVVNKESTSSLDALPSTPDELLEDQTKHARNGHSKERS
ncbi:hypothetical protein GRJ2_000899900 [Grus japonensis]|uniref:Uncharacterized protein n=1 Tax=Grus japonensis TaxID=30415 RepID=A0ABC9WFT8_GRUJA